MLSITYVSHLKLHGTPIPADKSPSQNLSEDDNVATIQRLAPGVKIVIDAYSGGTSSILAGKV